MKDGSADKGENFWPTLVEFLFATRSWWAGVCSEFDLTPAQGQALKVLDPGRPVPMSTLAEALLCDAGFREVQSKRLSRTIRFKDGASFLPMNAMAFVSMSAAGKTMSDDKRKAVVEAITYDSEPVLQSYSDASGLAFELVTNFATARG